MKMTKTNMGISKNIKSHTPMLLTSNYPFGKAWLGYLLSLLSVPFIAACSGDDLEQYAQRADNANEIGFMPRTENVTRATYSVDNPHPDNMGAYGFHDLSSDTYDKAANRIFSNQKVLCVDGDWTYSPVKYWPEYSAYDSFDFFGYMPYTSTASFSYLAGKYILSFTPTLNETNMTEGTDLPLICNVPHHKNAPGQIVNFDMDQTMTGFQLKFKLGEKMSKVREFEITKVVVSGTIPYKGKITRSYQFKEGKWEFEPLEWSDVVSKSMSLNIVNKDEDLNAVSLTLADNEFHEWGSPFFAIPVESFTPTISVTYNVKVADNGTVTRENVTNKIVFNKDNFANLKKTGLTPGKINSLEIAIVPDHLYILADEDQYIGYLVME